MVLTESEPGKPLTDVGLALQIAGYQRNMIRHGQSFTRGAKLVADDSTTSTRPSDAVTQDGYDLFSTLMPASVWQQIKDDELVYIIPDPLMNGLPLETLIVQKPTSSNAKDWPVLARSGPGNLLRTVRCRVGEALLAKLASPREAICSSGGSAGRSGVCAQSRSHGRSRYAARRSDEKPRASALTER